MTLARRRANRARKKPANMPQAQVFRGTAYSIHWRKPRIKAAGGTCDSPNKKNPAIEIWPGLNDKNLVRVLIDEAIHACMWDIDNDAVAQTSAAISDFLWNCGLRFTDE